MKDNWTPMDEKGIEPGGSYRAVLERIAHAHGFSGAEEVARLGAEEVARLAAEKDSSYAV